MLALLFVPLELAFARLPDQGIVDNGVPESYPAQLAFPFTRRPVTR